jgi:hypothetical protein
MKATDADRELQPIVAELVVGKSYAVVEQAAVATKAAEPPPAQPDPPEDRLRALIGMRVTTPKGAGLLVRTTQSKAAVWLDAGTLAWFAATSGIRPEQSEARSQNGQL